MDSYQARMLKNKILYKGSNLFFPRNSITFIKKSKDPVKEDEEPEQVVDDELKDEIRSIHGSVFDLYLKSLSIRH